MSYEKPEVTDFGSIAEHTFHTPSLSFRTIVSNYETGKFGECGQVGS